MIGAGDAFNVMKVSEGRPVDDTRWRPRPRRSPTRAYRGASPPRTMLPGSERARVSNRASASKEPTGSQSPRHVTIGWNTHSAPRTLEDAVDLLVPVRSARSSTSSSRFQAGTPARRRRATPLATRAEPVRPRSSRSRLHQLLGTRPGVPVKLPQPASLDAPGDLGKAHKRDDPISETYVAVSRAPPEGRLRASSRPAGPHPVAVDRRAPIACCASSRVPDELEGIGPFDDVDEHFLRTSASSSAMSAFGSAPASSCAHASHAAAPSSARGIQASAMVPEPPVLSCGTTTPPGARSLMDVEPIWPSDGSRSPNVRSRRRHL